MQNGTATLEDSWQLLTKLNMLLPHSPVTAFLSIYPKKLKTYTHSKTRAQMFTAYLFISNQGVIQ